MACCSSEVISKRNMRKCLLNRHRSCGSRFNHVTMMGHVCHNCQLWLKWLDDALSAAAARPAALLEMQVPSQRYQGVCSTPTVCSCDISSNDDRHERVEFVNDSVDSCVVARWYRHVSVAHSLTRPLYTYRPAVQVDFTHWQWQHLSTGEHSSTAQPTYSKDYLRHTRPISLQTSSTHLLTLSLLTSNLFTKRCNVLTRNVKDVFTYYYSINIFTYIHTFITRSTVKHGSINNSYFNVFYPRDAMLARVFATATCPSVCPSVCLSHAVIVPSRAKAGSWNVYHLIAPWL